MRRMKLTIERKVYIKGNSYVLHICVTGLIFYFSYKVDVNLKLQGTLCSLCLQRELFKTLDPNQVIFTISSKSVEEMMTSTEITRSFKSY